MTNATDVAHVAFEGGRFGRVITARIRPNIDLVEGIEQICTELTVVRAEVRSAIGSLTDAVLRTGAAKKLVAGPGLEIALASGYVEPDVDGQPQARLFGLVSDGEGRPHGGEFARGENPVFVTLELVLQEWVPDDPSDLILGVGMGSKFRAIIINQDVDKKVSSSFQDLDTDDLPEGEVKIDVAYSTLNYKDGLAVTGKGKIARAYPMVAGIDLSGTVTDSSSSDFNPGDKVVACGGWMSETIWGGYSEKASLPADIVVPLPPAFDLKQAMAIGTAGFTAMLSVMALEEAHVGADSGEIIVTGAGGGVGSVSIALLAKLGYQVVASTGRAALHDYLSELGAQTIVARDELDNESPKPLEAERWAGGIDSVGGNTLTTIIAQTKSHGAIAACGLAGGFQLPTTVMPFILRGVSLIGINSVILTAEQRRAAWLRLARDLDVTKLDAMTEEATFDDVPKLAAEILKGNVRGRTVIAIG